MLSHRAATARNFVTRFVTRPPVFGFIESKAEKCHIAREAFIHQGLQRLEHREKRWEKPSFLGVNEPLYR